MSSFQSPGKCAVCPQPSDVYGDHAVSCGCKGERIARHNHLRDAVYSAAASANLSPRKEEQALLPGFQDRLADVLIPNWSGVKDTALDITVINPLRLDLMEKTVILPGHALGVAHRIK